MPEKKNHFPILVNNFRIVARVLETKKKIKIVKLLVTKLILIKVGGRSNFTYPFWFYLNSETVKAATLAFCSIQ